MRKFYFIFFIITTLGLDFKAIAQDTITPVLTQEEIVILTEQANTDFTNKNYSLAIEKLTKIITSDNQSFDIADLRGRAYTALDHTKEKSNQRDYTAAIADFTTAIALIDKAIEIEKDRETKLSLRKRRSEILINRGIAKMHTENGKFYKLALDDFDEAYKVERDNMDLYINRAEAYYQLKEYRKEVFDLKRLYSEMDNPVSPLRTKLDFAELNYKLGRAIINDNNDKDAACKYFKKALNLGYKDAETGVKRHCKF